MPSKRKRVVVALSGGVDSSVAAYLLVKKGFDVIGVFMRNWHDESVTISKECPWLEDSYDAMLVSEKLSIPFQTLDLSSDYKKQIVDYMFREYKNGRTPNPDVLCNREIKFNVFLKIALNLGADFIATGHYCRVKKSISEKQEIFSLIMGVDQNKDQSYFLCQLSQEQLSKTIFPIGELKKHEVRSIAKKQNLITAEKKDSQGLCFVGKVKLPVFLQQRLIKKKGKIIKILKDHKKHVKFNRDEYSIENLEKISKPYEYDHMDGKEIGTHIGAHFFTIGQRKGLDIGGSEKPLYVLKTDVLKNIVYVGEGKDHPGLLRNCLFVKKNDIHFLRKDLFIDKNKTYSLLCRIRYRQTLQKCKLIFFEKGAFVVFENKQSAISKGQFVVWYKGKELLGSGVIN